MPATRPGHSVPRASDAASGLRWSSIRRAAPGPVETARPAHRHPALVRGRRAGRRTPRSIRGATTGAARNRPAMTSSSAVSAPPIRPVGFRKRILTARRCRTMIVSPGWTMSVSLASNSFWLRMIRSRRFEPRSVSPAGQRNGLEDGQVGLEDVGARAAHVARHEEPLRSRHEDRVAITDRHVGRQRTGLDIAQVHPLHVGIDVLGKGRRSSRSSDRSLRSAG